MKRYTILFGAVCAVLLAFGQNAGAVSLGFFPDPHVVGTISPAAPASPADVSDYINFMITLGLGQTVAHDFGKPEGVQTISRSTNTFGSLPTASATGAGSGTGTTIHFNGGFTYLFAKYDGQNDVSQVWNISGETGVITIPPDGPLGHGLSGWILFGPGGGTIAPDGGATAALLGLGLAGLAGLRAKFGRN